MAKIEGEPFKPRDSRITSMVVPWLTRLIKHLNAKGLLDLPPPATKTIKASEGVFTQMTTPPPPETTLKEDFQHNYAFTLNITSKDLPKLTNQGGRLVVNLDKPDPGKAKQLIQQTIRQARGQLIDAQHGYIVNEKALYELNKLNEHVRKFLPECVEKDPSSPVRILSGTYREKRAYTQKETAQAHAILKKTSEIRKASDDRIQKLAQTMRGLKSIPTPSFTKPMFVTVSDERVAIEKDSTETVMGQITADGLGKDPFTEWKQYAPMGGVNELIASNLNVILESKLGIPLTTRQGKKTIHAFADSIGSLFEVRKASSEKGETKQAFLEKLPQTPCQWFILGQLALGGIDCHADNVLFDPQMHPIAIDFGRSLGSSPLSLYCNLQACYLDWPAMDAPLSKETLEYLKTLNINEVITELLTTIEAQYADLWVDLREAIMGTFTHLEMRLVTLQEAAREGMTTPREMTALFLPPITEKEAQNFDKVSDKDIFAHLALHSAKHGFKRAFALANPKIYANFQSRFRHTIRNEILLLKGKPKKYLYGPSAERCYQRCEKDEKGTQVGFQMDRTAGY